MTKRPGALLTPGRNVPEALCTYILPGSAVWFPVAHRIYTFLPMRGFRQAFRDAGSVSSYCFVC